MGELFLSVYFKQTSKMSHLHTAINVSNSTSIANLKQQQQRINKTKLNTSTYTHTHTYAKGPDLFNAKCLWNSHTCDAPQEGSASILFLSLPSIITFSCFHCVEYYSVNTF